MDESMSSMHVESKITVMSKPFGRRRHHFSRLHCSGKALDCDSELPVAESLTESEEVGPALVYGRHHNHLRHNLHSVFLGAALVSDPLVAGRNVASALVAARVFLHSHFSCCFSFLSYPSSLPFQAIAVFQPNVYVPAYLWPRIAESELLVVRGRCFHIHRTRRSRRLLLSVGFYNY